MSLEIGSTIGDYRIIGILGAGGMGKVYKVKNLISDRVEAMKVLLPNLAGEVAQLGDGLIQFFGLYQQKIHVLSEMNKTIACSIDKAQRELGYAPQVELEEGMRRSLAWCLQNGIAF